MAIWNRQTPWEKEWKKRNAQEERFLAGRQEGSLGPVERLAKEHIPPKLQETLDAAFMKAFEVMFTKGSGIIEKTCGKGKKTIDYQIRSYEEELRQDRKSLKAFRKKAGGIRAANLAVSAVEGVGLGFLGIGLPDIPLFTGVIFKTLYEIALNYGYPYEDEQEQIFLLKIVEAAVSKGPRLQELDRELNRWMDGGQPFETSRKEQIERTAKALSGDLLYMKFVQGIPVAGIAGGISDVRCLSAVAAYGDMKYQRRFLMARKRK